MVPGGEADKICLMEKSHNNHSSNSSRSHLLNASLQKALSQALVLSTAKDKSPFLILVSCNLGVAFYEVNHSFLPPESSQDLVRKTESIPGVVLASFFTDCNHNTTPRVGNRGKRLKLSEPSSLWVGAPVELRLRHLRVALLRWCWSLLPLPS